MAARQAFCTRRATLPAQDARSRSTRSAMMPSSRKVLAGATVMEETLPLLPPDVVSVLDFGLHINPPNLKRGLQDAIDAAAGPADEIILGYGFCSMAVMGRAPTAAPSSSRMSMTASRSPSAPATSTRNRSKPSRAPTILPRAGSRSATPRSATTIASSKSTAKSGPIASSGSPSSITPAWPSSIPAAGRWITTADTRNGWPSAGTFASRSYKARTRSCARC